MEYDPSVFGYVNGKPVYSRNEYVYAARHFGAETAGAGRYMSATGACT